MLAATLSTSASDLFEVLHEDVPNVSFSNRVAPQDVISGMSFIMDLKNTDTGGVTSFEEATVCTIGMKNINLASLVGRDIPTSLFTDGHSLRRSEIESICRKNVPELENKIICVALRKLIRQSPTEYQTFLL